MGVDFDVLTAPETTSRIVSAVTDRRGGWLLTPNLSILRQLNQDQRLAWIGAIATETVCDGAPLQWLARAHGTHFGPRVTGAELVPAVMAALPAKTRVLFVGGAPGVAEAARRKAEVLDLDVVGAFTPDFGFDRTDDARAGYCTQVLGAMEAEPALTVMALPFPRQEALARHLSSQLPNTYFMNIGAGLGFWVGQQSRAPEWVQRLGLEWLVRLVQEPRRLWRRYMHEDLPFLVRSLLGARAARKRGQDARI